MPVGRPFPKGVSGNPGGRAKGYERRLREVVDGETVEHPTKGAIPAWEAIVLEAITQAVAGDRYARDFLADRLLGKPKQSIEMSGELTTDVPADRFAQLTAEQLEALAALDVAEEPSDDGPATPH
jgi:hypothetical protein